MSGTLRYTGWHVIRKLPEVLGDYRRTGTAAGLSPSYTYKDHFVKRTSDAPLEEKISRLFEHTKTPGAVRVRALPHKGEMYSISKLVPGSKSVQEHFSYDPQLQNPSHPIINAIRNMGGWHGLSNMVLSEYLAAVGDRHTGNYLVSPQGIHSIDHAGAGQWGELAKPSSNVLLQEVLHQFPESWFQATPDHLARWDRVAKQHGDVVPGLVERLAHVKQLARLSNGLAPIHDIG